MINNTSRQRWQRADARVAPNIPLTQAQQCLVTLTLDAGREDREVRRAGGVIARLSPALVQAFAGIQALPVAHRQEELEALSGKRGGRSPQREVRP